jgi:hypothetical protein
MVAMTFEARSVAVGVAVVAGAVAAACGGGGQQQPQCLHPCDLAQTVSFEVIGSEPLASVSVSTSDPCEVIGDGIALRNSGPGPGSSDAPLTCHVTLVGARGTTVEQDVTATYTDDLCCLGYEFPARTVSVTIAPADAGTGG